jgi:phospholipase C
VDERHGGRAGAEGDGRANLKKIDHIVVLMMENRSFDHVLGYLSLEEGRTEVDGLREGLANEHQGSSYPVHHLGTTVVADDPDHSARSVDLQIGDGKMDGFAASYAATLQSLGVADGDPGPVMGYYNAADVPVYDHLAREFAICDRWFSSVPGATWPNRLYALCGRAAGSRDGHPHNLPPFYNQPSFARHLDAHGISWRWYSSDVGTLRMADELYCLGHHDKFAYFTTTGLPWKARLNWRVQADIPTFLEDAAAGTLPSVSWIDPSFGNFNPLGVLQNDDHPPADVKDGQDLVLAVYHAVATGPQWDKTLLVIFYDEHGGFFDHVPPPAAKDDDLKMFGRYGVRVPAIIVSPWVPPRSVSKTLFDHTSVIKTILLRFCGEDLERGDRRDRLAGWLRAGHPHYLGRRVAHANDLGELLTNPTPRPAPTHDGLIAAASARAEESDGAHVDERTPDRRHSTDLQRDMAAAARVLKGRGHPAGRP